MPLPSRAFGAVLFAACILALSAPQLAAAEEATYSATRTVAVPPASSFKTTGGNGDGWAVAFSETAVYNVFHHQGVLTVACHLQSNGESCFEPETITDGEGREFATSGHPGMYMDNATGKLYIYATRHDGTGGVVCFDTTKAASEPNPFCGFTELTPEGEAPIQSGISAISTPVLIGSHWYAFNYVENHNVSGAENRLLCFDVASDEACAGQPFLVPLGEGNVEEIYPGPAAAGIGHDFVIGVPVEGRGRVLCFDDSSQEPCAGSWPIAPESLNVHHGSPFAKLDSHGAVTGFCLPSGTDECYTLSGEATETPSAMPEVIAGNDEWNGPGVTIGPRVYVPNGEADGYIGDVQCFDYATNASCNNFPKHFSGLEYLYTVTRDPQRPSCLWVNADSGEEQIQNFDAYTGGSCGSGPVRGLGTQFVAGAPQCKPITYVSLQVIRPAAGSYTSGTVAFADGDGEPMEAFGERTLDASGSLNLEGMELNSESGLPQFLFHFTGAPEELGSIEVKLTWTGEYSEECEGEGRSVVRGPRSKATPPPSSPPPASVPAVVSCTHAQLALVDVVQHGSHVLVVGEARRALAGRSVAIKLLATGQIVAHATIAPDGSFLTTAPLPVRAVRRSNRARYEAVVGSLVSLPLKLYRRMYMTKVTTSSAGVQLAGRVRGAFKAGSIVRIMMRQTCSREREVGRTRLSRSGRFSITVPAPAKVAGEVEVYRATTTVLLGGRPFATYTVPRPPGLA